MSTLTLTLLAVGTALLALIGLAIVKWREKKRLEFARRVVFHSDSITSLNMTGEELERWLSPTMLRFIGTVILHNYRELQKANVTPSAKVKAGAINGQRWSKTAKKTQEPLPTSSSMAQKLRESIRSLLTSIDQAYKSKIISGEAIKPLANEAKLLNVNLTLAVYEEKANSALQEHNHFQAHFYMKKCLELLTHNMRLSREYGKRIQSVRQRMEEYEKIMNAKKNNSRLHKGADEWVQENNAWKKKRF